MEREYSEINFECKQHGIFHINKIVTFNSKTLWFHCLFYLIGGAVHLHTFLFFFIETALLADACCSTALIKTKGLLCRLSNLLYSNYH